jgi:hypothetical protein
MPSINPLSPSRKAATFGFVIHSSHRARIPLCHAICLAHFLIYKKKGRGMINQILFPRTYIGGYLKDDAAAQYEYRKIVE